MPEYPHQLLSPRNWKPAKGYANGVVAEGRTVYLGGQVGWNPLQQFETDDFVGQLDQCLANISVLLAEANAGVEHVVRLTWYVTDKREYLSRLSEVGAVYRKHFGRIFPAMAMVQVSALIEDRAKLEIEATAVIPHQAATPMQRGS